MTHVIANLLAAWLVPAAVGVIISAMASVIAVAGSYSNNDTERYKRNGAIAVTISAFWPVAILVTLFWAFRTTVSSLFLTSDDNSSRLSRRQQRKLAFQREQLAIEQQRLQTQEQYSKLILGFPVQATDYIE